MRPSPRTQSATSSRIPRLRYAPAPTCGQRAWCDGHSSIGAWRLTRAACRAGAAGAPCLIELEVRLLQMPDRRSASCRRARRPERVRGQDAPQQASAPRECEPEAARSARIMRRTARRRIASGGARAISEDFKEYLLKPQVLRRLCRGSPAIMVRSCTFFGSGIWCGRPEGLATHFRAGHRGDGARAG
jgi:hypothetical protein